MSKNLSEAKRIVVTGAAGTVGRSLVDYLLDRTEAEIVGLDNNENSLYTLDDIWRDEPRMRLFNCDVRVRDDLQRHFKNVDIIFHGAALKHLPLCERSPFEAVRSNIHGVQNVIQAASDAGVSRVLYMSTDKAASPTTVMGTSKLMGERLIGAAGSLQDDEFSTVFTSTRFGNVAGSMGSVIPLFLKQIARGGPVTLTDPRMSRFIMTPGQAVTLMIESVDLARGGEVFVPKMPVIRINDLVAVMIDLVAPIYGRDPKAIVVRNIGPRPAEKLHEDLITAEEAARSLELENIFVIRSALDWHAPEPEHSYPGLMRIGLDDEYRSDRHRPISQTELVEFLLLPGVLPDEVRAQLPLEKVA